MGPQLPWPHSRANSPSQSQHRRAECCRTQGAAITALGSSCFGTQQDAHTAQTMLLGQLCLEAGRTPRPRSQVLQLRPPTAPVQK